MLSDENDVRNFIKNNKELMFILKIIQSLDIKEGCLCAGALRNSLWNHLSNKTNKFISDIDIIYFEKDSVYEESNEIQKFLKSNYPNYDWEVKNEIYMNRHNPHTLPYTSVEDAISKFPEKCTAIGARLDANDKVELISPYGVSDIIQFIVRPTPFFKEDSDRMLLYKKRIENKNWLNEWPSLNILYR